MTTSVLSGAPAAGSLGAGVAHMVEPKLLALRGDPRGGAVVRALFEDTHLPMVLADLDGVYQYVSPEKARLLGARADALVGRRMADVIGKEAAAERLELMQRCAASGRPIILECTLQGAQARSVIRPIPAALDAPPLVLIVHHLGLQSTHVETDRARYDVARSRIAPPIPLTQLTTREREVLTLIAQGLTQAQIGERLNRSVKTIEWHRASLGKKLNVNTAVELAHIAIRHGLVGLNEPSAAARSESPVGPGTSPPSAGRSPGRAS